MYKNQMLILGSFFESFVVLESQRSSKALIGKIKMLTFYERFQDTHAHIFSGIEFKHIMKKNRYNFLPLN